MPKWTYATARDAFGRHDQGCFVVLADRFEVGRVMRVSAANQTVLHWRAMDGQHGYIPANAGVKEGCRRVRDALTKCPHLAGLNWQGNAPGEAAE